MPLLNPPYLVPEMISIILKKEILNGEVKEKKQKKEVSELKFKIKLASKPLKISRELRESDAVPAKDNADIIKRWDDLIVFELVY